MFLYDKRDDTIEVYEMKPSEKIIEYKLKELEKSEVKAIRFNTRAPSKEFLSATEVSIRNLKKDNIGEEIITLSKEFTQTLIDGYLEGRYNIYNPKKVVGTRNKNNIEAYINYLLYSKKSIKNNINAKSLMSIDALVLDEALYKLQLIESGKFDLLYGDYEEQLDLFDLSEEPIDEFSLEELKRIRKYGAIDYRERDILKKVRTDRSILMLKL